MNLQKIAAACAALCACAIVLSPAVALAAPATPVAPTGPTLGSWLEGEFLAVGRSCFGNLKAPGNGKTAIPSDVRGLPTIASNLASTPQINSETSVRGLFAIVYKDGKPSNYQPIGTAFGEDSADILYENRSNLTIAHNCVTMFSASASTNLSINEAQLKAALSASYTDNNTQTGYVYAGHLISPITGTLALNSSVVDAPHINRLAVWLALWQFYRTNPAAVADAPHLQLLNEVDGVAMLRYRGLTQNTLLNGSGSVGFSVPFFSASAKTEASANLRQTVNVANFSIAYWSPTYVNMPTPGDLITAIPRVMRFAPASTNPRNIVTADAQPFSWDVEGVPSAYCDPTIWVLAAPANARPAGSAGISNLRIEKTPQVEQSCRFTVDVTPPAVTSTTGSLTISFNIASTLAAPPSGPAPELKLNVTGSVQDFRAAVAFRQGTGAQEVTLSGDKTQLVVTYPVKDSPQFKATGVVANTTEMRLACEGLPVRTLAPSSAVAKYDSGSSQVNVTVLLPSDLRIAEGAMAKCVLVGETVMSVTAMGDRSLSFPEYAVDIKRPASSQPRPAPTVSGDGSPPPQAQNTAGPPTNSTPPADSATR